jgi:hypothetical protein
MLPAIEVAAPATEPAALAVSTREVTAALRLYQITNRRIVRFCR